MSCGTALEARRNSDERWTFTPSSRNYTFSGMAPLFTVRRGDVVLLQIDQTQTVNGSLFSVVGDSVVLQLKKGDAALLDGPTPDTDAEALFYDVTLTDQTGFENWIVGGPFTLLGLNDASCGGCNEKVEVTIGGQCIQINIEGGNTGIGASVNLAALNQAVRDAQEAAQEAEQSANQAATAGADAGAAAGSVSGASAGSAAGATAGESAAQAVVATKLDKLSSLAELDGLSALAGQVSVQYRTAPGDGYAGTFEWIPGDQSANVSKDTGQGVWVAPSADPTGASGAWKRIYEGPALLDWFEGVDPSGATPSHVGLQRAFNSGLSELRGSPGAVYVVSADNLSVPSNVVIEDMTLRRRGYNVGWLLKNSTAGLSQDNENITFRRCHFEDDGLNSGRGNMLKMDGVKSLTIEDCSVFMSSPYTGTTGAWSTYIAGEDIRISGWRVNSLGAGLWSDGMHLGQVRRFSMRDFHIQCGDDGIALHFPPENYGYLDGPSRDIVIGDGYISAAEANGIRIGAYGAVGSDPTSNPDARWENVLFHDVTFGPCAGCISIYDNRGPSEITSKNTGIVFDGMNFGDQANTRLIFIAGNPNTEVAGNYTQHNFRDITLRNITGRQSQGQLITGGGADRVTLENVELSKAAGSPATSVPDVWFRQIDRLDLRDCAFDTTEPGSAIRFQTVREVNLFDPAISGGSSNPFALVVMDRPTDFNAKLRVFGGTISGGQRLFNGNGPGTLDEFIVQGTYLSNFTVSDTSILAATTYRFSPSGQVMAGSGSPEGVVTATRGAIWQRRDGAATTTVYYKNSGSGNTGWAALSGPVSGTTANRPTGVAVGQAYFDTTLGKPVWFKATSTWVDATGATV